MTAKQCERARFLYVFGGKNEKQVADALGVPLPDMLKFLTGGYLDAEVLTAQERLREQRHKWEQTRRAKQRSRAAKPDVFDTFVDSIAADRRAR